METERLAADPRVIRGLEAQFKARGKTLAQGAEPTGWKIGINAPPVMEALDIASPVIGFLSSAGRLDPGERCSISAATRAALEPEIAIHIAADVPAGTPPEQAAAAIGALGAAIEIVDIDLPFEDLEAILAGNVFHHSYLLGPADPALADGDLSAIGMSEDLPDAGLLAETVAHVAGLVGSRGELLRAGEVIISGSLTIPQPIEPGENLDYDFGALGTLKLDFA